MPYFMRLISSYKMEKKTNLNRPDINSEEISKGKNFDSVLKKQLAMKKPFYKKNWFLSSIVVAAVTAVTAIALQPKDHLENNVKVDQANLLNADSVLTSFYLAEESKPTINPPLAGVNVTYTVYKVMAEKGAALDFKTGSRLLVPKNAFVDENGKLLKGEVELRYREFHDAVDFFVSGIPMTYDSAGQRYHFESAGMMEMLAYQNGKPVNVAPEKSINVALASNYKSTEYNLYKLDTVKNNWSCLGKDKVVANAEKSASVASLSKPSVQLEETPEYKTIETAKLMVQKDKEVKIASLPKLNLEPKKPEEAKKDKYTFNIDVSAKEYPELAVYKGVLFEVGPENKGFTNAMYDITWDEAVIKDGIKKGENYSLTLKKNSKKYDIVVYPVFEGKDYEKATKDFQEKFAKYNGVLEKRKADEIKIEEEYQSKLVALKKQQQELELKWKQQDENNFKLMSTVEKVQRMFAVNSFGVYNCDKPSVYPKGVTCSINLTNDKDVKLMCYDVFLVDRSKNGLFSYTKNPITTFSFDPKATNLLWTVDNGVLYWLKPEQFNNLKSIAGISNLKMNRVDQKFKSADEIKVFFNL